MKKTALLILLLALCLLVAPFAVAEGGPVARSDAFAAYTDGEGHLYLSGRTEAVNGHAADSVVGIDAYRVLYLSPDDFLDTQDLYMVDLQSLEESLIATDVRAACLADDDTAWYVTGANRAQLFRANLRSLTTQVAYTAAEPIDRLYLSAEGLIFQLVDQAATMLYVEETDRFESYNGDMPRSGATIERYEAFLTDGAELYLKSRFNYSTSLVDSDVTACAWLDNTLYYLTRTGTAPRLKAYDPAAQTSKVVLTPGVKMKDQLTASGKALFMLAADNTVCRVDTAKGTLAVFKRYADLSGYKLPTDYNVDGLRIEGMSGQLNVYAQLTDKASKPTFSFIEFESEADVAAPVLRLIDTLKLTGEQTASDQMKPTPQYATLSRGSRGDAVSAIQQPLKDLGYYDYYVDGIYGPRTQAAVQLLQFDLERPVTGVADAELQRIILSGKLGSYDPYLQLARGNRGMRVRQMQERLRELGYLADAADGIFGPRTLKAVQLFQNENGLGESGAATRETLKRLYSDRAVRCSSYIDLYPGDTGYRVRELNNRLRELYYLESSPGSTYTSQTTSAIRVFQRTAGLRETGDATVATQRLLFSDDAPEALGYIVLRRGDDNERVARLQRRLRTLNYYDGPVDGYFGRQTKEAVALFQKKVGLKPSGIATVRTQSLLFSDDAPEYVKPTVIGVPDIYLEDYDYVDHGTYFISEESTASGYIFFSWDVEGEVDYYNVRVTDSMGHVYVDNDTHQTGTAVSLATLDYDIVYTLRVKAYPEDGNRRHITEAEVDFVRIDPEDEQEAYMTDTVGLPEIDMDTVARREGGVSYLMPGTITFVWYAEGDVGSYGVLIEDESGTVIVDEDLTVRSATISSEAMTPGEIYTITVSAIPESGNLKAARSSSALFALPEVELPEPDPTPEPSPEPTPEPTPEVEVIVEVEPEESLEPMPTFEPTPEPEIEVIVEGIDETMPEGEDLEVEVQPLEPEVLPAEVTEKASNETAYEEPAQAPEAEETEVIPAGEPLEVQVEELTEAPAEVPVEAPAEELTEEPIEAPVEETLEPTRVSEPTITLDYVETEQDGVSYISSDVLTMTWQAEGDVAGYKVDLLDSNGYLLDSRTVDTTSLSAHTSGMDPAEVYTLVVTAIPAGGTEADGAQSSVTFALYTNSDVPVVEGNADATDEWQDAEEAWQNAEEEYQAPEEEPLVTEGEPLMPEEEYQAPVEETPVTEGEPLMPEENPAPVEETPVTEGEPLMPEENPAPVEETPVTEGEPLMPEEEYQALVEEPPVPVVEYQEPVVDDQEQELVVDDQELVVESLMPEEEYQAPEVEYQEPGEEETESGDQGPDALSEGEIIALQDQLVTLRWLEANAYTPGVLDEPTVNAIISFQKYCNLMFAMELQIIDPTNPKPDAGTVNTLMSADSNYANPNAVSDDGFDESYDEVYVEDYGDGGDEGYDDAYEDTYEDAGDDDGWSDEGYDDAYDVDYDEDPDM